MAAPKNLHIVESIPELKKLQKASIPMIANRIKALIEFKKNEKTGISKRAVADNIGVNHNSVQTWRKLSYMSKAVLQQFYIIKSKVEDLRILLKKNTCK
jgi:hypothetical protein